MRHRFRSLERLRPAAALLAGSLLASTGGCDLVSPPPPAPAVDVEPAGPRKVFALGSLEPAGGVISISAVPGDRLKGLAPGVGVNKRVPADGVLGLMTSHDTRLAQREALATKRRLADDKHGLDLAVAEAQVVAADASLAQASAKVAEVKIQERRLAYLEEAAAIAASDLGRLKQLAAADPELVTPHQLRRQSNRVDAAQTDFEIASETFLSGLAAAETAREAALANKRAAERSLEKLAAMNPVLAVDEEVRLADQLLAQSVLMTPDRDAATIDAAAISLEPPSDAAGTSEPGPYTVLKVFLRPGEAVTQTPVLQVADLSRIVCIAEVYEADAKSIRPGQKATITSEAFIEDFAAGVPGKVESVSRMVATGGLSARNPLAPVDRSVLAVRVAIDPANTKATAEAGRWIGLQVKVAIEP